MVRFEVKPSEFEADCWSVEVVNGGFGFRFFSLRTTSEITYCADLRSVAISSEDSLLLTKNTRSSPLPVTIRFPAT